jgi:hypothetical protein
MASLRAGGLALSSQRRMGSAMFMASDMAEDSSAITRVSRATNAGQLHETGRIGGRVLHSSLRGKARGR